MLRSFIGIVCAVGALLTGNPAGAQKAQDSIRVAINDMFPGLDTYAYPSSEASPFQRDVYNSVVAYDERQGKYVGVLAKSWKRIAPNILEFDLQENVTFHSGNPFTADDAIYTWKFFADPKVKIRSPSRYDWIADVEKLGPYKLRVISKQPFADDLDTIATFFRVFDSKIHSQIADYTDYGRVSGSGTGPYRLLSLDRNGLTVERFDQYKGTERAVAKRVSGMAIPDEQTRVAQLLTGGIDVVRNISSDSSQALAANPNIAITNVSGDNMIYITLDAAGRSANKVMTDPRVRKAFMMAINRDAIIKQFFPGGIAQKMDAICYTWMVNCSYTTRMADYDPQGARKLLAEAGYADGFDLQINVSEAVRFIAEAVSGDLRKVGIRATIQTNSAAVYTRLRGRGELTAFLSTFPIASLPNAVNLFDLFFLADRDYYEDATIHELYKQATGEVDEVKRKDLYARALDRVNEMNYIFTISTVPASFAHSKDVKIMENAYSRNGIVNVNDMVWADYRGK